MVVGRRFVLAESRSEIKEMIRGHSYSSSEELGKMVKKEGVQRWRKRNR